MSADAQATAHFVEKWYRREPEMRIAASFCVRADAAPGGVGRGSRLVGRGRDAVRLQTAAKGRRDVALASLSGALRDEIAITDRIGGQIAISWIRAGRTVPESPL